MKIQIPQRPQLQPFNAPPPQPAQPRRRRARDAFRWEWLLLLLLLFGVMWVLAGVDGAAFSFDAVMDRLNVRDRDQYRELATLGLVAVAIVWVTKTLKSTGRR